jgi:hypothetical protein
MLCKILGFRGGDYVECRIRTMRRLLVTASVVPSSPIRRFLQEPHGVTSQNTPFFLFSILFALRLRKELNAEASLLSSGVATESASQREPEHLDTEAVGNKLYMSSGMLSRQYLL